MAQLSLLNLATTVQLGLAAAQRSCSKLINLTTGSATRAIIESGASVALWMQMLIVLVYQGTRLSTSVGTDVDTFVQDFTISRQPAIPATGNVTFNRFSSNIAALIRPYFTLTGTDTRGARVKTVDQIQEFGVVIDTSNPLWNQTLGGYFVPIGVGTASVPVRAFVPGEAGNIIEGSISLLSTSVPGIDTVTNVTVFSNGRDPETDGELKSRFAQFIATRARATIAAVANAIQSVQQGLSYAIIENTLPNGFPNPGFFTVTIDDGTGAPPTDLIAAVFAAVDTVRPIGTGFTVQSPAVVFANVNMIITAAAGYSKLELQGLVAGVIQTFINGLGIGHALSYTRLSALAFSVPGVSNVSNVILNGGSSDIGGGPTQVVKATGASVVIN